MDTYNHWVIEQDEQHIIWLGFDRSDSSVNSINNAVLDELNAVIQSLEQQTAIKGLILYAAKEKGFVAGADVKSFSQFKQAEEAVAFLQKGQMVFSRLEALSVPTLAMIDGFCMGGGLELALACTYRIGTDEAHTRLGLPEVLLGIHPGWGGTVRLPQLMGGFQALTQMILTGRTLSARQAKKLGVLDEVVPSRQLKRAARHFIETKP
ncbi:MAG TPA: crotonase, partial [Legionellales bacterium]|nr:crotonase [Legionellales bacterium]